MYILTLVQINLEQDFMNLSKNHKIGSTKCWKQRFYFIFYIFKALAFWADAFYKSICPSICPCVRVSVCLCVRVFTFEVPLKRLFAPTFQSRMSNIFKDLESLGKSNGKKLYQIWIFFFESCLNLPRKKRFVFFADFALQHMVETTLPDGLETSGQRVYP